MIRFIAAIDLKRGLANDQGIPWLGLLPTDIAYFRGMTLSHTVLMGYGEYAKKKRPLSGRRNLVATTRSGALRDGFEKVADARKFLLSTTEDVWVDGGAGLFASTLDLADELYLTLIDFDFHCTVFFPEFKDRFGLQSKSKSYGENDLTFHFEIWKRSSDKLSS